MKIIRTAAHVAYFDPMVGAGMLVLPDPAHDMEGTSFWGEGCCGVGANHLHHQSLHESDRHHMLRQLWTEYEIEPLEDEEWGDIIREGALQDGRAVLSLYGPSITSEPTLDELDTAIRRMGELVGLVG